MVGINRVDVEGTNERKNQLFSNCQLIQRRRNETTRQLQSNMALNQQMEVSRKMPTATNSFFFYYWGGNSFTFSTTELILYFDFDALSINLLLHNTSKRGWKQSSDRCRSVDVKHNKLPSLLLVLSFIIF